jgi:hypothetical protein
MGTGGRRDIKLGVCGISSAPPNQAQGRMADRCHISIGRVTDMLTKCLTRARTYFTTPLTAADTRVGHPTSCQRLLTSRLGNIGGRLRQAPEQPLTCGFTFVAGQDVNLRHLDPVVQLGEQWETRGARYGRDLWFIGQEVARSTFRRASPGFAGHRDDARSWRTSMQCQQAWC